MTRLAPGPACDGHLHATSTQTGESSTFEGKVSNFEGERFNFRGERSNFGGKRRNVEGKRHNIEGKRHDIEGKRRNSGHERGRRFSAGPASAASPAHSEGERDTPEGEGSNS